VKFALVFVLSVVTGSNAYAQNHDGPLLRVLGLFSPADNVPQTKGERFKDYVIATVGPLTLIGEAASAGIQQWRDSPHEWGQGASGYGQRFGNDMAYNAVHQTITYGLSEALREDNRYFRSEKQGTGARLLFALESPAMAYHHGKRRVSISSLTGIAGAATLSLTWAPPSWQGAGSAASNFGITYASMAGLNVAREFIPSLVKKLRK
jgi:hypothetical protein